jgi:transposase InsO family protein
MTRQNYYKTRKARLRREVDEDLVVELVKRERRHHPRMGVRKLYYKLENELREAGVEVGRDRVFEILRERDLLVKPLPRKRPRTTDSRHALPVFRNLIAGVETTGPNQIWVSDITYVRTQEGYEYVSLIMDLHSHKVVGYHCGDDLSRAGSLRALEMALEDLPEGSSPIHHSDRGCQYCSHDYVDRLNERGFTVSMTEENHCAENATAERLNGILKQEYALGAEYRTRKQARAAVRQAVALYNNERPHTSLHLQTPAEVHKRAA